MGTEQKRRIAILEDDYDRLCSFAIAIEVLATECRYGNLANTENGDLGLCLLTEGLVNLIDKIDKNLQLIEGKQEPIIKTAFEQCVEEYYKNKYHREK